MEVGLASSCGIPSCVWEGSWAEQLGTSPPSDSGRNPLLLGCCQRNFRKIVPILRKV